MGLLRKAIRFDSGRLAPVDLDSFYAFAYAKQGASWALLSFCLPLLFVVGWLRDYSMFGQAADVLLQVRLGLVAALLAIAMAMHLPGGKRKVGALAVVYVGLFSLTIAVLTTIEPAKLSLTHVTSMLMLIILLPYALHPKVAIGMVFAQCLPIFGLLGYLHAPLGLWWAYFLFSIVGVVIGLAQRNANLNASLEIFLHRQRLLKRLHLDNLTGLSNREGWEIGAQRLLQNRRESGRPMTVLFIDLDNFKAINDLHGHAVGDAILKSLGETARAQLREIDLVARIGGEEFVVLLPDTDFSGAHIAAERLRKAVETMKSATPITISIGLAVLHPDESLDSAMHRADQALLRAKQQGRNRSVASTWLGQGQEAQLRGQTARD